MLGNRFLILSILLFFVSWKRTKMCKMIVLHRENEKKMEKSGKAMGYSNFLYKIWLCASIFCPFHATNMPQKYNYYVQNEENLINHFPLLVRPNFGFNFGKKVSQNYSFLSHDLKNGKFSQHSNQTGI